MTCALWSFCPLAESLTAPLPSIGLCYRLLLRSLCFRERLKAGQHASVAEGRYGDRARSSGNAARAHKSRFRQAERSAHLHQTSVRTETRVWVTNSCAGRYSVCNTGLCLQRFVRLERQSCYAGLHNYRMHIGWFEEARLLVLAYNVSSRLHRLRPVRNARSPRHKLSTTACRIRNAKGSYSHLPHNRLSAGHIQPALHGSQPSHRMLECIMWSSISLKASKMVARGLLIQ